MFCSGNGCQNGSISLSHRKVFPIIVNQRFILETEAGETTMCRHSILAVTPWYNCLSKQTTQIYNYSAAFHKYSTQTHVSLKRYLSRKKYNILIHLKYNIHLSPKRHISYLKSQKNFQRTHADFFQN